MPNLQNVNPRQQVVRESRHLLECTEQGAGQVWPHSQLCKRLWVMVLMGLAWKVCVLCGSRTLVSQFCSWPLIRDTGFLRELFVVVSRGLCTVGSYFLPWNSLKRNPLEIISGTSKCYLSEKRITSGVRCLKPCRASCFTPSAQ